MTATTRGRPSVSPSTPGRARDFPRKPAMLRPDQLRFHPRNVRRTYTGLEPLAASIKTQGVLLPLLAHRRWVTPTGQPEVVELLAGHRRALAAEMAGLHRVPVILRPRVSDDEALLGFLAEDQKECLTVAERRDAIIALHTSSATTSPKSPTSSASAWPPSAHSTRAATSPRPDRTPPPSPRSRRHGPPARRTTPSIRPTAVHELITAWEDDQITGADAIHELRAMLGGWVPGTTRATTSATAGASAGSTPPPPAAERGDPDVR